MPTGETREFTVRIGDRESRISQAVTTPITIGEYDSFEALADSLQAPEAAEPPEDEEEAQDAAQSFMERLGVSHLPEHIELEEPSELTEFKQGILPIAKIEAAAKEILTLREMSDLDDDKIPCADCEGNGAIHRDYCYHCMGSSYEMRDMEGNITEKKEPDPPDPDCTTCKGEGNYNQPCDCCGGSGEIDKCPSIVIINNETGAETTVNLDVAQLIAEETILAQRRIEEEAYDNGLVRSTTSTYLAFADMFRQHIEGLGFDPENTGIFSDGKIYEAASYLLFDLPVSTDYWQQMPTGPEQGIHSGEIRANRQLKQSAGFWGKRTNGEYDAKDFILAAQHQLSRYFSQAFSEGRGDTPQRELYCMDLIPLPDAFEALTALVASKDYSLGFRYHWDNGSIFDFFTLDKDDEVTDYLTSNYDGFRAAVENARLEALQKL